MTPESFFLGGGGGGGGRGGWGQQGVLWELYKCLIIISVCMHSFISDKTEDQVCRCHVMYNGQLS